MKTLRLINLNLKMLRTIRRSLTQFKLVIVSSYHNIYIENNNSKIDEKPVKANKGAIVGTSHA